MSEITFKDKKIFRDNEKSDWKQLIAELLKILFTICKICQKVMSDFDYDESAEDCKSTIYIYTLQLNSKLMHLLMEEDTFHSKTKDLVLEKYISLL